jgi:poly(3-hydroxybutyrate) depolymerase
MLYRLHELNRALLSPAASLAQAGAEMFSAPGSWLSHLPTAAPFAAGYEVLYRLGKEYQKPEFGIEAVSAHGATVGVIEQTVLARPFCRLQRFTRHTDRADVAAALAKDPVVLVVAPLSGHHATLLRDAVRTLASAHDVYVTDWIDARMVPRAEGGFGLGDYVGYLREFIRHLGGERLHILSVCQAAVPALAAVALDAAAGQLEPRSLIMMGGPLDGRRNPTVVNQFALSRPLSWFDAHLVDEVPARYPGRGRRVYPGFLQHASFIAMNPFRHMTSHLDFYRDLIQGELRDAESHRRFYDEYNAVLDLPAEFYLDCIRIVFQEHLLPRGLWHVDGERVAPEEIRRAAMMTVEGEVDDISGRGQTEVAHELCVGIPAARKRHLTVASAGHYGIFSGRRWTELVYPQVRDFIASHR